MATELKQLPFEVRLGSLSEAVFQRLGRYTSFPWPVMQSQCKRCELDPSTLDARGLKTVLPHLVSSVARFTTTAKGEALRAELEALIR